MPDKNYTERGADMTVFAVAKKDPYIISSDEAKIVFSAVRDADTQRKVSESASRLQTTCLKRGAEIKAARAEERKD